MHDRCGLNRPSSQYHHRRMCLMPEGQRPLFCHCLVIGEKGRACNRMQSCTGLRLRWPDCLQERAQEILREKLVGVINTYEETSKEIQSTLAQMNEAFELLMAKPNQARAAQDSLPGQDEEGLEWEDVAEEDASEGEARPLGV